MKILTLLVLLLLLFPVQSRGETDIFLTAASAPAKETILFQEIPSVYGASKYEQKVTEAPSSVSIVTSAEIKKYGYRTLADLLRSVRGFFVTFDRNYSYAGVRGFNRPGDYNSRILLLVDGHRVNDNIFNQALIGTEFVLDVDLIDRVEIIRGPSSSIYGSNAFFAVINVITKKGRHLKGGEVSGEVGSLETLKGRLSYGDRFNNGMEMILSGSILHSQGNQRLYFQEYDDPATHFGIAENCDKDQFQSLFSTLSYKDFTLQGAFVKRDKSIPTASFGTDFNEPFNRTTDGQAYLDLKYERDFENLFGVTARIFYDRVEYKGDYIYEGVVNKDETLGDWLGTEVRLTRMLFKDHKIVLGGEFIDNLHQNQTNYDQFPHFLYFHDKRETKNWALYLQDEFTILRNLIFNAGVRHDHFETFGGTTNPRAALIYNPLEKTTFKLLYGTAFRAPNAYEFYYQSDISLMKSNPDLRPEKIQTYELIYEQYIGKYFRGTSTLFYYKITDLISQTVDPTDDFLVFRNFEQVKATGVEFELEGKWPTGLEGRISYTFQRTKNEETGATLTNSPSHLAKFNLIVPVVKEKVFLGMEEQFTSRRKTLAGKETNSALITNLTLFTQSLIKGLEISGSVYNMFDKKFGDPGSGEHRQDVILQDGRSYRLKLTYSF